MRENDFWEKDFWEKNFEKNNLYYNLQLEINGCTWRNINMWHTVTQSTLERSTTSRKTSIWKQAKKRYHSSTSDFTTAEKHHDCIEMSSIERCFFNLKTKNFLLFFCGPLRGQRGGGGKILLAKIRWTGPKRFDDVY